MSVLLRNKLDSFFSNRPFLGPFLLQGLFSFMHVAWHDIFSLSDHFPQAGICISPVILRGQEQMLIFSSSLSINNIASVVTPQYSKFTPKIYAHHSPYASTA